MKKINRFLQPSFHSRLSEPPANSNGYLSSRPSVEGKMITIDSCKILNLNLYTPKDQIAEVELATKNVGVVFKDSFKRLESGVLEMDLNGFSAGVYSLKIVLESREQNHTLVLPRG